MISLDSEVIDVPKDLNADQVDFFLHQGYLVVPDMIDVNELDELKRDIIEVARGRYPCDNIEPISDEVSDDEVIEKILCVHMPHYVSPLIEKYVKHPKICGALSQLTGAHIPFWDGSVKCMQSMYFVKPPQFQGQAWHQDERFIPTRDRSLVGVWIALDDATLDNGCLRVIPGSHKMGQLWPTRPHNETEEFDLSDESYGFSSDNEEIVEVNAGSAVFFNGYLLHRSLRNQSDTSRRALVHHYMNAWSNLPWQIGADRLVDAATHDHRMIVPIAGDDPYPERGIEASPNEVFIRPWGDEMEWGNWDA